VQSLIFLVGTSGAGKSKALDALSDFGYFNLENVPVELLPNFLEVAKKDPIRYQKLAILPDINSTEKLENLLVFIDEVTKSHKDTKTTCIYIDCSDAVIVRRYSETRRPHPCFDPTRDKTLEDAIIRERTRLSLFRDRANLLLDTTHWNIHELRRELVSFIETIAFSVEHLFRLNFLSFGFKYGLPNDCDIIMDARFLPNPYFIADLREKDGTNQEVSSFVLDNPSCKQFLDKYLDLLSFSLPLYISSGKQYLNVGIGCTGGKHRSVAIAECLSKEISDPLYVVSAKHRDRDK
jgi:UPF0042 nucleotide-binding protein